jgi:hypothetical protein
MRAFLENVAPAQLAQNARLLGLLDAAINLMRMFCEMDWVIAHAPAGSQFLTSDNPFVFGTQTHTFPISSDCCVGLLTTAASTVSISHRMINSALVHRTNVVNARLSDRFVLGADASYLRQVIRDADIQGKAPQPFARVIANRP